MGFWFFVLAAGLCVGSKYREYREYGGFGGGKRNEHAAVLVQHDIRMDAFLTIYP